MSLAIFLWVQILSSCSFFFIKRITIDSHRSSHSVNNNFKDFRFLFHGHNTSVFSSCLTSPFPWSSDDGSTPLTCPLSPCSLFMALQPFSCDVVFVFFFRICVFVFVVVFVHLCICICIWHVLSLLALSLWLYNLSPAMLYLYFFRICVFVFVVVFVHLCICICIWHALYLLALCLWLYNLSPAILLLETNIHGKIEIMQYGWHRLCCKIIF